MGELLLGCSGWNYPDTSDKGGWTGVFYPDKDTKRLRYYSQFFNTAEVDSTFYEKFYSHMTNGTFMGMTRASPEKFQFSIKVPETVTHVKRLDIKKGAMTSFEEFLNKISPLRTANKLGAILFQLGLRVIHGLTGAIFRIIGMRSQRRNGDLHPYMKG
jgi:uncharacterized protein YecE (DUF72 family)